MSTASAGILARKLEKPVQAEGAGSQTPMRALRMAVARASPVVFGAEIDVIGVEITQSGLDDLVSPLSVIALSDSSTQKVWWALSSPIQRLED